MSTKPKYSKATPPNDCAHLLQGQDSEIYRASDLKRMPDKVSWRCRFGDTIDISKFPDWVRWHFEVGGPSFQPHKHCPDCPSYAPLGDISKWEEMMTPKGKDGSENA